MKSYHVTNRSGIRPQPLIERLDFRSIYGKRLQIIGGIIPAVSSNDSMRRSGRKRALFNRSPDRVQGAAKSARKLDFKPRSGTNEGTAYHLKPAGAGGMMK